jgi:hypothetical protein
MAKRVRKRAGLDVFYYLDRTGTSLQRRQILQLQEFALPGRPVEESALLARFPNGLSRFGLDIIHARLALAAFEREFTLEAIRIAHYPDRPSRCVAVFGFKNLEAMHGVGGQFFPFGNQGWRGRIWPVQRCSVCQADMNLFIDQFGDMTGAARAYWSQEKTEAPLIEHLLAPPVTVLKEIVEA